MENFRHRSPKLLLPRKPGDSHSDNKSVILQRTELSCLCSALLSSPHPSGTLQGLLVASVQPFPLQTLLWD